MTRWLDQVVFIHPSLLHKQNIIQPVFSLRANPLLVTPHAHLKLRVKPRAMEFVLIRTIGGLKSEEDSEIP
jgi:hypothetical protein